jgi:hypothetical protein
MDDLHYSVVAEHSKLKFHVTVPACLGLIKLLAAKCFAVRQISDQDTYQTLHDLLLLKNVYHEVRNYNKSLQILLGHFLSPVSTLSADLKINEGKYKK